MANYGMKVGMLILLEPDVDKAAEFYEKLGFQKRFQIKGQWAEFALGDVKFGLCPTSQELPEHHTGIVLEVSDLNKIYNELKQQGVPFINEPKSPEHGIMVSFKDPGNNIIDLYQPTPEKVREIVEKIKQETEKQDLNDNDQCCGSKKPGSCADCSCSDDCNCIN